MPFLRLFSQLLGRLVFCLRWTYQCVCVSFLFPGGYVGAIRAAQLGLKVACIDRDKLGGVCLNWGCIPSKALLHGAEIYDEAVNHGKEWGINIGEITVDWSAFIGRSRKITGQLNGGVAYLFKKNNIEHIQGHAHIVSEKIKLNCESFCSLCR
ncbi:MAG TPA: hypothetical protein EYO31_08385, partial [Phycisphaerales bacterium]|nr:hypothetical protein [Phycisphaerales bacterium]